MFNLIGLRYKGIGRGVGEKEREIKEDSFRCC